MADKKPEKLTTFAAESLTELEKQYNSWTEQNYDKIEIIDRKFQFNEEIPTVNRTLYVVLIFYREK